MISEGGLMVRWGSKAESKHPEVGVKEWEARSLEKDGETGQDEDEDQAKGAKESCGLLRHWNGNE